MFRLSILNSSRQNKRVVLVLQIDMKFLITAGPTREALDPVRYLTNRSSGKMGYALASAAAEHGQHVILISGPTSLDVPDGIDFIPVESADDMYEAVEHFLPGCDVAILCAAVADYKPAVAATQKIKKTGDTLTLELVRTRDILGSMRDVFGFEGYLVGFAAETNDVENYARGKLVKKKCDLIVANDVSQPGIGFDSSENAVSLIYEGFTDELGKAPKLELAHQIIHQIIHTLTHP